MEPNFENAVGYHYDQFPPVRLNYEGFVELLVRATDAVARYDQMLKSMHNSEILLAPMRGQEAVISSRIEGTITTMDEILRFEADYEADGEGTRRERSEIIETILYRRALINAQQALEDGHPFSESLIKAIHQRLLSYGRGARKSPGKYKTEQNYLADAPKRKILFIPISPEKLPEGMEKLFEYIGRSDHTPLIKTALAHVEFEALHPFQDGNGRIGRMLITLMLWNLGSISAPHFYISGYLEDQKDRYLDTMRNVSRSGDWDSWCVFFLEAVEKQAIRNLETAEEIRTLYEEMKAEFSEILSSKWSINALDFVFTRPIFRNNQFTSGSGIPASTAARFTRVLLSSDLITLLEEGSGRRAALYSFEPLMRLVRV